MADQTLARIEARLSVQADALSELIEIALLAVKESGASSVSAIHLNTRLLKLADSLSRCAKLVTLPLPTSVSTGSGR
ncbi:MAG: hypothetical protein P4L92_23190 [Rudaea sp.]|nr:hypothetical protein [Rudaea sp.]